MSGRHCTSIPDPATLDDVVRRLQAAVSPMRIILFGSAARREMNPDSDLDLLVVVSNESNRIELAKAAYRALRDLGHAKDNVVVREEDVQLYGDNPYMVIHNALRDGKELYLAAS